MSKSEHKIYVRVCLFPYSYFNDPIDQSIILTNWSTAVHVDTETMWKQQNKSHKSSQDLKQK